MKKGLLVACTMISILLQVVSFSFRSDAATTYLGGDIFLDAGSSWDNNDIVMSSSSFNGNSPSGSDYATYSVSGTGSRLNTFGSDFHIYFTDDIPANTWIHGSLRILFRYDDFISPITFDHVAYSLNNPGSVENFSCSVTNYSYGSNSDRYMFMYNFSFYLNEPVNQIQFTTFTIYFRYVASGSGTIRAMIYRNTILSSEPVMSAYGDVLDEIEQNTENTTNAINDQTDTLTDGYDNSQIEQSNTQLADSMQDYDSQQAEITDQATGYIDDVAFVDPSSQVQLAAAITYSASWLQSLFVNLGDWGILVVVSLSLAFAFMLIGWYKYRK